MYVEVKITLNETFGKHVIFSWKSLENYTQFSVYSIILPSKIFLILFKISTYMINCNS